MPGKFGSPSQFLLVDGYNLQGTGIKSVPYKIRALNEDTTGIGDAALARTPTGVVELTVSQAGAFFDTTTNGGHAALKDVATSVQATARVLSLGFAGNTVGETFVGAEGAYTQAYEVLGVVRQLTKANAEYAISGRVDQGFILKALAAITANTNGTAIDNAASSASGGAGHLQVTAYSGFTNIVVKVQHSPDNSVWADLITFATVSSAPTAERKTAAGTVDRYTRYTVTVTGSGSATFFVGFARH